MYKCFFKRLIDFIISLLLLPFVLIPCLIIAVLIKMDDGGPVLFFASRIGKNGRIFKMFKFRSMKVNSPDIRLSDGSTFNSDNDPRVTKIGKMLRRTSLDEIPQFFNVLIGDMALIGPRPDSASYLDKYTEEERIILDVRPGISGYNQAINRNSVLTKEKLQNDIYYVKHLSFLFDLKIIFWSFKTVFSSKNVNRA